MGARRRPSIFFVSSPLSPEFTRLIASLKHSTVVAFDCEWEDGHSHGPSKWNPHEPTFTTVSILQIACLGKDQDVESSVVFLVDLDAIPLKSISVQLNRMLVSPRVLKLGFCSKQDVINLFFTFRSRGCEPDFDKVEPYVDISGIYKYLHHKRRGSIPKEIKGGLKTVCEFVLNGSHSKGVQRSYWSRRPLTKEQEEYAAEDVRCLLRIFDVFQIEVDAFGSIKKKEVYCFGEVTELLDRRYGATKMLLKESDKKPKPSNKKRKSKGSEEVDDGQCLPPWDPSLGGDGRPKFLCDDTEEGLAEQLRCVGIDAAVCFSNNPEAEQLRDQALSEERVLLTRNTKLRNHLAKNQIFIVKSDKKKEQLHQVIEKFQLKIRKDELMSRCSKCNDRVIVYDILSTLVLFPEKAEAITDTLEGPGLNSSRQCMGCNRCYWEAEGSKYYNAIPEFNEYVNTT